MRGSPVRTRREDALRSIVVCAKSQSLDVLLRDDDAKQSALLWKFAPHIDLLDVLCGIEGEQKHVVYYLIITLMPSSKKCTLF